MTRFVALALFATPLVGLVGCGEGSSTADLDRARVQQARSCLTDAGFAVLGGPRSKGDRNAPDFELTVQLQGADQPVGAFIGFYKREERAARLEPGIRRNAKRFNGIVERRGPVTIIWTRDPSTEISGKVERCIL